jgi:polysaccharide biosynthesis transport protein
MNPDVQSELPDGEPPPGGLAFGDILFIIFRHKFIILFSVLLGIGAAVAVRYVKPPNYESTAQIYVPYVVEIPVLNPNDPTAGITRTGGGEMQMSTEVDLLKSFDTALEVVDKIGAEKILARYGGGSNRLSAAGVVASGIWVGPPRAMSLTVTFSHRDGELVQPVMQAIMDVYMHRHKGLRLGDSDELLRKRDEANERLTKIETSIKELNTKAGVPDLRQRQEALAKSFAELQEQIFQSELELDRRRAALGEMSQSLTNLRAAAISTETITRYSDLLSYIDEFKRRYWTMLYKDDLTTNHPSVLRLESKLQEQQQLKLAMEREYPTLTNYLSAMPRTGGGSNAVSRFDLEIELAELKRLDRNLEADTNRLATMKAEAFALMELERDLSELERQRVEEQRDYEYYANSIKRVQRDEGDSGKVVNMKPMQTPTPPSLNKKKMLKMIGVAFGGCVGMGLGIAFLIDMFLDRSIRRPAQILRLLRLPVVLTIPDMDREESYLLPWAKRNHNRKIMRPDAKQKAAEAAGAMAPWSPDNQLQSYVEGLRERVITHFEVKELSHHPKLVALAGCTPGAGVSTLASGLAASLSRTGSGSVLLVDLNAGDGVTHSFYKGKPGFGPSESPDDENETGVARAENLSLAKRGAGANATDRLDGLLPPEFNEQVPKLKAGAYDYIVFDMTQISPASVTPRMSGRMDLVLFVIESEKTKQHTARSACELMRESRANVVAILNKYHNPVPERLAHD